MYPWALALVAQGRWLPSLDNNFVIQVDFKENADTSRSQNDEERADASASRSSVTIGDAPFSCSVNNYLPASSSESARHLIDVRLQPFKNKCWKVNDTYWSHEICFRKSVRQNAISNINQMFVLGRYDSKSEVITGPRSLREWYRDGTAGRTTSILYKCGRWNPSATAISEPKPMEYEIIVYSPSLCYEVEKTPNLPFVDDIFRESPGAALLEAMWARCWKLIKGWWTYEYCYPYKLVQYHQDEEIKDPVQNMSLGYVFPENRESDPLAEQKGSEAPKEKKQNLMPSSFHEFKKGDVVELSSNGMTSLHSYIRKQNETWHHVQELHARPNRPSLAKISEISPMRSIPVKMGPSVDGFQGRGSFYLELRNGTHCDETGYGRETKIIFVCPPDWDEELESGVKETEIISITETSVCRYEIVISTPAVCAHPRLLPQYTPKEEQIITCKKEKRRRMDAIEVQIPEES
eukprot:GEMP01018209.1.p1 GENE.GEMP01018209.1~~GEMP01018209.1.p1  ORF type:complete len:464 (+),score=65.26 GEMP01018209.1:19-1410(+)